jgi:hypothetical protein
MPTSGGTHGSADRDQLTLTRYVRDYLAERGESERALARRAVDPETGLALNHGWINQLAQGQVNRAPELWRIRALAAGMRAPAQFLASLAAAQWLGVEVVETPGGREGEEWVTVTVPPGLSPEERDRFVRMVEDIARHLHK